MGTFAKDAQMRGVNDLGKYVAGLVPVWADAGYRVNRHIYVGAYFQFALASTSGDVCMRDAGGASCSSSGTDIRFGVTARYAFSPDARFDPWVGAGFGYEMLHLSETTGPVSSDLSTRGFELFNLQLGGDYALAPGVTVGPFVMLGMGQYGSYDYSRGGQSLSGDFTQTGLHEWLFLGLRGQYDL
jgi:hypothetical protein